MPFEEGNQLWREGLKTKMENKTRLQQFFDIIAEGGIKAYGEKLEDLSLGVELSKPEVDFMDRLERHLEFVAPKLARSEVKTGLDEDTLKALQTYVPRRALDKKDE